MTIYLLYWKKWIEEIDRQVGNDSLAVFSGVHPNPIIEDVIKGSKILREKECDSVIGIGGIRKKLC